LAETFPDATFVLTHRDPVEVIRSMATMIVYASRMACSTTNPAALAAYWCNRADDLLSGCLRDRDALPPDRTVDIRFDDFMADEMGTLASIYQLAGQPFDDEVRTAMADFLAANPRGRYGGVEYDLAGLGLDAEVIAARLADYRRRFVANDEEQP
ncbi:MAG TPA: sulfotransferase, partial [Mycolicibacterium fallax]|nr:sulfotransferase [Mycolicibacterium fallax]